MLVMYSDTAVTFSLKMIESMIECTFSPLVRSAVSKEDSLKSTVSISFFRNLAGTCVFSLTVVWNLKTFVIYNTRNQGTVE